MGNRIEIDDGSKVYDIYNKRGTLLGQFTFIPSDFDLVKRYEDTVKVFEEMQKEIQGKDDADVDYINDLDRRMEQQIDQLFHAPVSEAFFSITSPFTSTDDGKFFVENVIDAIRNVIELERGKKLKAIENRVKQYTDKYKIGPGGYIAPK